MRRFVLLRHGATAGGSEDRLHGSSDVELSPDGREQIRLVAARLGAEGVDVVAASPLKRAWQSARILAGGRAVRLVSDLREIHFGRWEGLSREEIEASDPILFEDWEKGAPGFEFPGGEPRADFRKRVERGLEQLAQSPGHSALVVTDRVVIRTICELLTGEEPPAGEPALGEFIELVAQPDGSWIRGRRSSDPAALQEDVA